MPLLLGAAFLILAQAPPMDSLGNPLEGRVGGLISMYEERSDEYRLKGILGGQRRALKKKLIG